MALLLLDATSPATRQDLALASKVVEEGRALVVLLNKMDAVPDAKLVVDGVRDRVAGAVWEATGVQCVPICAKTGQGVEKIMPAV